MRASSNSVVAPLFSSHIMRSERIDETLAACAWRRATEKYFVATIEKYSSYALCLSNSAMLLGAG
jgi:hypothetical protein